MVASECAPVAKVGGLGDVVFGLSRELEIRGNAVEIILPKYDCLKYDRIWNLTLAHDDLWVPWFGGRVHCSVYFGFVDGRKCFFIDPHSDDLYFNRGKFYGNDDDNMRFTFFSKAALEFLLKSGKRPDIIHCHDWQTSLIPVMLYEQYAQQGLDRSRVCLTVHNFAHQGLSGDKILWATRLGRPNDFFRKDRLQDDNYSGALNLLKGGIVYSNFVTTVSPHHAWEAMYTIQGFGMGHTLHQHGRKFMGILNGIDCDTWNPEIDTKIPQQYSAATPHLKYENKAALRRALGLRDEFKPIIASVGRLDAQKGVGQIMHTLLWCLRNNAQFVLLGTSPDPHMDQEFRRLRGELWHNPDCHLEIGFNEDLARLIYAGSDFIVVPSAFEPCGLTQLISLKYGTVPIVREVGGLRDTVFDWDYSDVPRHQRNGFSFQHQNAEGIESALQRAIGLWWGSDVHFRELMLNGMRQDYSWNKPGEQYLQVYQSIAAR